MIITLLTDFGLRDAYVGAMKGAILGISPGVTLVDLTHNVAPQDVRGAAFLLHISHGFFPSGTVHVVVVDPGVGTGRRAIGLSTPNATFVAPDNGLLSYILDSGRSSVPARKGSALAQIRLPRGFKAVHLTNPRYWRHPVSKTFHGRDIFAPVAAHLAIGVSLKELGEPASSLLAFPVPRPMRQKDGSLKGHIQHVDAFGNLITDVREGDLASDKVHVSIAGRTIEGISLSYEEGQDLLAIFGSSGYLEIAVRNGNAASALAARVGDRFALRFN